MAARRWTILEMDGEEIDSDDNDDDGDEMKAVKAKILWRLKIATRRRQVTRRRFTTISHVLFIMASTTKNLTMH
jgi:hypothetical protein